MREGVVDDGELGVNRRGFERPLLRPATTGRESIGDGLIDRDVVSDFKAVAILALLPLRQKPFNVVAHDLCHLRV